MLRSSHDACGCSTQTTSTINLKRSTLHPHEGQADRPNTPSDSVNRGSNPGPPATDLPDMTVYFQFSQPPEKSRYFRALALRRTHRCQPETQNARVWGANGRRVSQGRFRVVGCRAFRLGFDGGLGGEAENMSLFAPVVRQVLAQSQESGRRELDR